MSLLKVKTQSCWWMMKSMQFDYLSAWLLLITKPICVPYQLNYKLLSNKENLENLIKCSNQRKKILAILAEGE